MTREPGLFDAPVAHARNTDPETSHAAARSHAPEKLRISQADVLRLFRRYGPMADGDLLLYADKEGVRQSPSGLRTRRKELVVRGRLRDTGQRVRLESGRRSIVWGIA